MEQPSLILFGPQTERPAARDLAYIREIILKETDLRPLFLSIRNLPQLWERLKDSLVTYYGRLNEFPCERVLDWFQSWLDHGHSGAIPEDLLSNVLLAPLTVVIQASQYFAYIKYNGFTYPQVIEPIKDSGIQGQCIGFLTATALSLAKEGPSLGENLAVAFQLAFCVGVIIDLDWYFTEASHRFKNVAVRCSKYREGGQKALRSLVEEKYRDVYVSVLQDDATLTLGVPASKASDLIDTLTQHGYGVVPLELTGRYHHPSHAALSRTLTRFCRENSEMCFSCPSELKVPLRTTANGETGLKGDPVQRAIESILLYTCDWKASLEACLNDIGPGRLVVSLGLMDCLSSAFSNRLGLKVVKPWFSMLSDTLPGLAFPTEVFAQGRSYPQNAVAVIGMACRFPGANSPAELWDVLSLGCSLVREVPEDRFSKHQLRRDNNAQRNYWGNFVSDIANFDHKFFKMSSREAASADPQQRLLLQISYQAMEDAGYFSHKQPGRQDADTGCFIGCATSDYSENVASHPPTAYSALGTLRAFLSGRVSYYFGWSGPSITYDTACSSSMVAIHAACNALQLNECSQALAGGVNLITAPTCYQNLQTASFLSPTGPTKAFDAQADGYCRADGVGLVVLKKLQIAIEDGDTIHGIISKSAINQSTNSPSITAPNTESQIHLFRKVLAQSDLSPKDISFVEAHGTGTQLGDKTECESIRSVFGSQDRPTLHMGSIKSNIGHTEGASGVASLIKVLLMMRHRAIPPQVNFSALNPGIHDLKADSIHIPRTYLEWKSAHLAACINNYGAAGSNAVMVVEQPTQAVCITSGETKKPTSRPFPVLISASSETSLKKYLIILRNQVEKLIVTEQDQESLLEGLVHNLSSKRNQTLPWKFTTVVTDVGELLNQLRSYDTKMEGETSQSSLTSDTSLEQRPVVLAFGGQHGLTANLREEIFKGSKLLRNHLHECDQVLRALSMNGILPAMLDATIPQSLIDYHCTLFALQYSFARTWIDAGLQVTATIGHSFGQLTALCISGCLSLKDALKLVSGRAALITKHCGSEAGSMMAIEGPLDTVQSLINMASALPNSKNLEIACFNGPSSFVVVGSAKGINFLEKTVNEDQDLARSLKMRRLELRCGFHSRYMDPILPEFRALVEEISWREPTLHLETCSEFHSWAKPSAQLIIDHTRTPVFFAPAVQRLSDRLGPAIWLEAGIGSPVIPMIRRVLGQAETRNMYLPILNTPSDPWKSIVGSILGLWRAKHLIQDWSLGASDACRLINVDVPPYQFDESRHWLEYIDRHDAETAEAPQQRIALEPPYASFIGFCSKTPLVAEFHVNSTHTRFKLLTEGHAVLGIPLCPGSLYTDLAIEASTYLANECQPSKTSDWIPDITHLEILAPLGHDAKNLIKIVLTADASHSSAWKFEFTSISSNGSGDTKHSVKHAAGHISLFKQSHDVHFRVFNTFERIVGVEAYQKFVDGKIEQSIRAPIIYNMFTRVIDYGSYYMGLQAIDCCRLEAVGQVRLPDTENRKLLHNIYDPLELDSFLQVPGAHINCLREDIRNEAYVTTKMQGIYPSHEYINSSSGSAPTSWVVYSKLTECSDRLIVSDIFVFNPKSKRLAMVILGAQFTKVAITSLLKVLRRANATDERHSARLQPSAERKDHLAMREVQVNVPLDTTAAQTDSRERALMQLLSDVLDVPVQSLTRGTVFQDLGIDSLMIAETLNGIRQEFDADIPVADFLEIRNIEALCGFLGILPSGGGGLASSSTPPVSLMEGSSRITVPEEERIEQRPSEKELALEPDDIKNCFDSIQSSFDDLALQTGFYSFWKKVHPYQNRLVVAYIVEAFAKMGCPLNSLEAGDKAGPIETLPAHAQLKARFFEILRGAGLVNLNIRGYLRTSVPLDTTPSDTIYADLLKRFPNYGPDHEMLHVTGPRLFECLSGKANAVDLIFGSKDSREILTNCYANTSIVRTANLLLQKLLTQILGKHSRGDKVRILEIGAGTGGTTKLVMEGLTQLGINLAYDFTDISVSMVNRARKEFVGYDSMNFMTLNVEETPPESLKGQYHVIISTNCIHATSSLLESCKTIRTMLRQDGMLVLVEHTRNVSWFDLVFGLLDGWWKFQDDRTHALADEIKWESVMRKAGFEYVDWTDQNSRESQTIRIILGLLKRPAAPSRRLHASNLLIHGKAEEHCKNLFTFPGGFGTGSTYSPLPKLRDELAVYALNSPFLNDTDKFTVSLEDYARMYIAEIRRIQPYGPYSIMGYSVGGVVAYEAVRQMIEDGDIVEQLFFIDSACPLLVPPLPLSIIDFLDAIDRFSGHGPRKNADKNKTMYTPHIQSTLICLGKYSPLPVPADKAPPTVLFRVREGVDKQDEVPRPKVSEEDEKALKWLLDDREEKPDLAVGWEELLGAENLSVVYVDGNHFSIMTDPLVGELADKLRPLVKV